MLPFPLENNYFLSQVSPSTVSCCSDTHCSSLRPKGLLAPAFEHTPLVLEPFLHTRFVMIRIA